VIREAGRLAWAAFLRFRDHKGPDRAAAVAYYTLLSLIPLLIFVISLGIAFLGSFDEAFRGTLFLFQGAFAHLDPPAIESLRSFVEQAARLRWPGLLLLVWTSRKIFISLFAALETVFEVPGAGFRGFARGHLVALAMVLVTGGALLALQALTTAVATAQGFLKRHHAEAFLSLTGALLTHVVPALVTFVFLIVVYRVVPRRTVSTAFAVRGALIATLLWEAAKLLFQYYVRNLARFSGLYGAFEAVIVLALWLELSVSIVLYCGELVAVLIARNRRRAEGSTA
jgi:membrane protein